MFALKKISLTEFSVTILLFTFPSVASAAGGSIVTELLAAWAPFVLCIVVWIYVYRSSRSSSKEYMTTAMEHMERAEDHMRKNEEVLRKILAELEKKS